MRRSGRTPRGSSATLRRRNAGSWADCSRHHVGIGDTAGAASNVATVRRALDDLDSIATN